MTLPKQSSSSPAVTSEKKQTFRGLESYLADRQKLVDSALDQWLLPSSTVPQRLHEAMRYSVCAGGKRIRPILCLAVAEGLGASGDAVCKAAAALELMHTSSLIHDDLPALDNDDLRRGRPTSHKVFGEAMAIMAGDALIMLSFQWLADLVLMGVPAEQAIETLRILTSAVGNQGMVAGQVLDLQHDQRSIDLETLQQIHRWKTGALLRAAVEIGAVMGGAGTEERQLLARFGDKIGLLFQIVDDILDVVGTAESLGKTPGKDQREQKATYPNLLGLDEARQRAQTAKSEALQLLAELPRPIPRLRELTEYIHHRVN
ncbi:MAG TPA: polyprenyl synthetase family protein [Candidatus Ozemobacteraceae bacterium]|nr:polyprenyl synthetase family protein [Candidatus Ozemobacteraceae bacterium]